MEQIPTEILETFPKKIYLQTTDEDECDPFVDNHEATWCTDRMHTSDVEYTRSDLCEGKEKEIAELKNNLINYRETVFNEWTEQETLKQRISELEAEKERIIALLERQVRQIGSSESIWPQFKTENNL